MTWLALAAVIGLAFALALLLPAIYEEYFYDAEDSE